jgi:hypothetical protein
MKMKALCVFMFKINLVDVFIKNLGHWKLAINLESRFILGKQNDRIEVQNFEMCLA